MKFNFLFVLIFAALILVTPAGATITTLDEVQTPELLYLSIAGLFFLLGLIVYTHTHNIVMGNRRNVKIEYFIKATLGGLSMTLAFLVSTWFSGGSIILTTSGSTAAYNVQSQALSYFFLVWGLIMAVYTFFGAVISYFNDTNTEIERGFGNDRIATTRKF